MDNNSSKDYSILTSLPYLCTIYLTMIMGPIGVIGGLVGLLIGGEIIVFTVMLLFSLYWTFSTWIIWKKVEPIKKHNDLLIIDYRIRVLLVNGTSCQTKKKNGI